MRRVRAIVSGRVQGVSYRAFTVAEALLLGLTGWVKNRVDGTVALEAQGAPERVADLLVWCKQGPPQARVSVVAVEELTPVTDEEGFSIRATEA